MRVVTVPHLRSVVHIDLGVTCTARAWEMVDGHTALAAPRCGGLLLHAERSYLSLIGFWGSAGATPNPTPCGGRGPAPTVVGGGRVRGLGEDDRGHGKAAARGEASSGLRGTQASQTPAYGMVWYGIR